MSISDQYLSATATEGFLIVKKLSSSQKATH
jgi:hypothetical protein